MNAVHEEGPTFERLLAQVEAGASLIDQAAQATAEAVVEAAKRYGYIPHMPRSIEKTGEGVREIIDNGIQMRWLLGKIIPLDLPGGLIFRTATQHSMDGGHWWYPGRLAVIEQAMADPDVQAVVAEWQARILEGRQT